MKILKFCIVSNWEVVRGGASPDSGYDVRFIYMRPKEYYLRLDPTRDAIEWQSLCAMIDRCFVLKSWLYHDLSIAQRNYREHLLAETLKLKKYFYVLRPLLACRRILVKGTPPSLRQSKLFRWNEITAGTCLMLRFCHC